MKLLALFGRFLQIIFIGILISILFFFIVGKIFGDSPKITGSMVADVILILLVGFMMGITLGILLIQKTLESKKQIIFVVPLVIIVQVLVIVFLGATILGCKVIITKAIALSIVLLTFILCLYYIVVKIKEMGRQ